MLKLSVNQQYIVAIIIYIIAYLYCLVYAPTIAKNKSGLNKLHEACLFSCDSCNILTKTRGKNYYISTTMTDEEKKKSEFCLLTWWGFAHFMLYSIIGFICPDIFWETFVIGIGFEVYEHSPHLDCHDELDIVWNSMGFLAGRACRGLF